jgi:membrane-associated phospholipid phosphatase
VPSYLYTQNNPVAKLLLFIEYMQNIIRENRIFFICYTFFICVATYYLLTHEQGDEILFFSDHRTTLGDLFFAFWTHIGEVYLYVVLFTYFALRHRRAAYYVLGILVMVGIASWFTKDLYDADRPYRFFTINGTWNKIHPVEGVDLNTGRNSYPSGHTMSAFALFSLVAFWMRNKTWVAVLLFLAAALVGISRIYLVQHFLRDVWAGSMIGVYLACATYTIFRVHSKLTS